MNTYTQPSTLSHDIESILGLHDMSDEERVLFFDQVGTLIIESTVLKYVVSLTNEEQEEFTRWLEVRQHDEDLLKISCEEYPVFGELLAQEMDAFQSETKRLFQAVV